MREILFRGKRVDNNEWVEGGYFIEPYTDKAFIVVWNSFGLGFIDHVEVVPETVGQYIGLRDRQYNRIFEGDLVRFYAGNCCGFTGGPRELNFGVFNCSCCDGVYGWEFVDGDIRNFSDYIVVGNIHDNPEMLKVD